MKPYRPSNGTEGDCFMAEFCERCIRDKAARAGDYGNGCDIIVRTMFLDIEDADYPTEWVEDDDGTNPRCTAFLEDGGDDDRTPQHDPDPAQLVLIADPTEDIAGLTPAAPTHVEVFA